MNQTQHHWEHCWDSKATWGASRARRFKKRLWDNCAFLSSRPVCLPRGLCLQSTAVYQACCPTSLLGARRVAVQTCLSTSGQRAAGAQSREHLCSPKSKPKELELLGADLGANFPHARRNTTCWWKEQFMEAMLSVQLYSGGRKNAITRICWQLGELCFSGAGMKHLTFGGTFLSKKVFKHWSSRTFKGTQRNISISNPYLCTCTNVISGGYVVLIYFQTEKKDAAIQAQIILITAVLTALLSTLERTQHFCVVTICSSHCAQVCKGKSQPAFALCLSPNGQWVPASSISPPPKQQKHNTSKRTRRDGVKVEAGAFR